ncbi:hypothetical protein ACQY0O_004156 [Thecaphora frezii]
MKQYELLLKKDKTEAWQFLNLGNTGFFFDLGDFRIMFTPFRNGKNTHLDRNQRNVEILGALRSKEGKAGCFLYIGRTTLPRYNLRSTMLWNKKRGQGGSLGMDDLSGIGSRSQGKWPQQEQATIRNRRRARKGKQPQQEQPM